VTAGRFFERRGGASGRSDGSDFCAAEIVVREIFPMVVEVFRSEAWSKSSDEGSESLAIVSTFDGSGHTGILTSAAELNRRWLRQRKSARKDEDCTKHLEIRAMALIPC
jgi:hypothetical protein